MMTTDPIPDVLSPSSPWCMSKLHYLDQFLVRNKWLCNKVVKLTIDVLLQGYGLVYDYGWEKVTCDHHVHGCMIIRLGSHGSTFCPHLIV